MPYDQELHTALIDVASTLETELRVMGEPNKGDLGRQFGVNIAKVRAHRIMLRAFNYYLAKVPLRDEEIVRLLPEMRGAVKLLEALMEEGAQFPLPILSQIAVRGTHAARRLGERVHNRLSWMKRRVSPRNSPKSCRHPESHSE